MQFVSPKMQMESLPLNGEKLSIELYDKAFQLKTLKLTKWPLLGNCRIFEKCLWASQSHWRKFRECLFHLWVAHHFLKHNYHTESTGQWQGELEQYLVRRLWEMIGKLLRTGSEIIVVFRCWNCDDQVSSFLWRVLCKLQNLRQGFVGILSLWFLKICNATKNM